MAKRTMSAMSCKHTARLLINAYGMSRAKPASHSGCAVSQSAGTRPVGRGVCVCVFAPGWECVGTTRDSAAVWLKSQEFACTRS